MKGTRRRGRLLVLAIAALLVIDWCRPPARQWSAWLELAAIHGYQAAVSPWLARGGVRCRFTPTCSHYATAVVARDGALVGTVRAAWRVVRCGPWTPAGTLDPP